MPKQDFSHLTLAQQHVAIRGTEFIFEDELGNLIPAFVARAEIGIGISIHPKDSSIMDTLPVWNFDHEKSFLICTTKYVHFKWLQLLLNVEAPQEIIKENDFFPQSHGYGNCPFS